MRSDYKGIFSGLPTNVFYDNINISKTKYPFTTIYYSGKITTNEIDTVINQEMTNNNFIIYINESGLSNNFLGNYNILITNQIGLTFNEALKYNEYYYIGLDTEGFIKNLFSLRGLNDPPIVRVIKYVYDKQLYPFIREVE